MRYDPVHRPAHYNVNGIEVIDVIETYAKSDFRLANVIKYVCRCEYKGKKLEDLQKAAWYLNRVIEELAEHKLGHEPYDAFEDFLEHELEVHPNALPPDEYSRGFWDGHACKEQELNDPAYYVQPSAERVPGSDGPSHRDYYNYVPDSAVAMCANNACRMTISNADTYIMDARGRKYCSHICSHLVNQAEGWR